MPSRGLRQSCRGRQGGRQTEAGMLQGHPPAQAIINAEPKQPGPITLCADDIYTSMRRCHRAAMLKQKQ